MTESQAILRVSRLTKTYQRKSTFAQKRTQVQAVKDVSFDVLQGETLGLVGESGSGKTTIANCVLGLVRPTSGSIVFRERELTGLRTREMRAIRRELQVVFQDPYSSLNTRRRVEDILLEPLRIHRVGTRQDRRRRVGELLDLVGLPQDASRRFPGDLSGGQRQRVVIARALSLDPSLLVCDEPVSALDQSVQAQILNLLRDIQSTLGLTMIFISHDLGVVRVMCDRIAVMKSGDLLELRTADQIYENPSHQYTRALLDAVLEPPSLTV